MCLVACRTLTIAPGKASEGVDVTAKMLEGLPSEIRNPSDIQPVPLPLEVQMFTRMPIVLTARFFAETAKPTRPCARLYIGPPDNALAPSTSQ
jgi:hypothetical protein